MTSGYSTVKRQEVFKNQTIKMIHHFVYLTATEYLVSVQGFANQAHICNHCMILSIGKYFCPTSQHTHLDALFCTFSRASIYFLWYGDHAHRSTVLQVGTDESSECFLFSVFCEPG